MEATIELQTRWLDSNDGDYDTESQAGRYAPATAPDHVPRKPVSWEATRTEDVTEYAAFMRGALPSTGIGDEVRQSIDNYYAVRNSMQSDRFSTHSEHEDESSETLDANPCLLPYRGDGGDETENEFEPVGDLPSLPRLDFKPLMLRTWVLIAVIVFYVGLIAGLAILYYYQNNSRIFHVHATASRFTIRILPSVIGTVSTLIFQAVLTNYARILPYIIMAQQGNCEQAEKTLLAPYFPLINISSAVSNRHVLVGLSIVTKILLNPFITPAKSTLIHKTPSEQDPDSWAITISSGAALYLMFNYLVIICLIILIFRFLFRRRTGLKWDPVSIADQITLLQGSDLLDDFSGLEYQSHSLLGNAWAGSSKQFDPLKSKQYRLGYWFHRPTKRYWHGIRKWPSSNKQRDTTYQSTRGNNVPAITDQSPQTVDWWRSRCKEVLDDPYKCYKGVYFWINDYTTAVVYVIVVASAAAGVWTIFSGRLETGFAFPKIDLQTANFILTFIPTFWFGLINNFWYQADIWYRQLQTYMGLRQPSPAAENLLLGYPCDLPVVITIKALAKSHWRLALTSAMPLIHRLIPILAGSLFSLTPSTSSDQFNVTIQGAQCKFVVAMLCAYIILIPVVWPGLDRRLPIVPFCMADHISLFYDSTLVRDNHGVFYPHRRMDEERWHMEYRLSLAERRYGFGIYPGRYSSIHIGIDDVYGYDSDQTDRAIRFLAPLRPPVRFHRRWLKGLWAWTTGKLNVKRQPTWKEEELEVLERLNSEVRIKTSSTTTAAEVSTSEHMNIKASTRIGNGEILRYP